MADYKADFNLPRNAYTAFDATSLKSLMKERLGDTTTFTGQNFEASNMSAMIDVIAYSYHVLLFYLNQTATESMFSEAELYENMNRIVKSIDYKPIGYQTSVLTFEAEGSDSLPANTYTIPRYSFFSVGGVYFSFASDITFTKTTSATSTLTDLSEKNLLYQGLYREYPLFTAVGEDFETKTLVPGDDLIIDHFNMDVYVKSIDTGKWSKWERTDSLYLEKSTAKKYEVRLNEHKRYEIKFGNNSTGKRLAPGDTVGIYYLESDGKAGEIGPGALDRSRLTKFDAVQFSDVFDDIRDTNIIYMTQDQMTQLLFTNTNGSSEYYEGESVKDIRQNAPNMFGTQHRLVTKVDYEAYIKQTYNNIVKDVKVVNNWDYVDGHLKYNLETLSLDKSADEPRTLLNTVNFADACDFNNVYCYVVPRLKQTVTNNPRASYLTPSQKSSILSGIRSNKTLASEIIITDPVFIAVDLCTYNPKTEDLVSSLSDFTKLKIVRSDSSAKSFESIRGKAVSIIKNYFDNLTIGESIDLSDIQNEIYNIGDITSISTVRTDTGQETIGININAWNPVYPTQDISNSGSGITVPYYKYPYWFNVANLSDKIDVVAQTTVSEVSMSEY